VGNIKTTRHDSPIAKYLAVFYRQQPNSCCRDQGTRASLIDTGRQMMMEMDYGGKERRWKHKTDNGEEERNDVSIHL
jgi:hypothetical protein